MSQRVRHAGYWVLVVVAVIAFVLLTIWLVASDMWGSAHDGL